MSTRAFHPRRGRLASLDALRGFDMAWIIGGDALAHLLALATGWQVLQTLSAQMRHAAWQGFHAYDLIFPLFMFLSGVSLSLSLESHRAGGHGDRAFLAKAAKRALLLLGFGVIYNFGWSLDPARFRLASVLGQIGLAYLGAALVFALWPGWRARLGAALLVLAVVAAAQWLLPVPGHGAGVFTPDGSVNGWLDRMLLPGRLHGGNYDPEGLLNIISSLSVTLAGGLAGMALLHRPGRAACAMLALAGLGLLAAGWALAAFYPVIKALWTVPFNLLAVGWSALALALFHGLIDGRPPRLVARAFMVIGVNSIGIYMAARFFAYPLLAQAMTLPPWTGAGLAALVLLLQWWALWACYQRGWIWKV
ncbi:MAG: DUF5009 domain-containing protein [Sphingomonadales bacterium]